MFTIPDPSKSAVFLLSFERVLLLSTVWPR